MKILSPVGNFESLRCAIVNGADEIYLGVKDFNARNNIDGFSMQNLSEAVNYAHIFGVKVLLAINILFSDDELQSAVNIIVEAFNMGVDAFIVQDLGLIKIVCKNYPEIELHASTQMGLHNLEGVKQVIKYGIKRVVLARETPLSEIKRIKENTDIEIEYFAHGALCVSFSGNCYLSSYLLGASGNRGRCKQLCRLPYKFLDNGKIIKSGYLLSAKDFNMLNRLKDLNDAGVDVLKIEGRARRPYYVATITKAYRRALNLLQADEREIKLAFNRNFTEGYFNGNGQIISDIQNHIGIKVGKVESVNYGKNFNEIIISSNLELCPKSTFKFFDGKNENNTLTAFDLTDLGKGKYRITTTQKINMGDSVHLIVDANRENEELSKCIRRDVEISLNLSENQPIHAFIKSGEMEFEALGDLCQKAQRQPIGIDDLKSNFEKSEYFNPVLSYENLDNVFLTKKQLNGFRRAIYENLEFLLTRNEKNKLEKIKLDSKVDFEKFSNFQIVNDICEISNAENIIYSPKEYNLPDVEKAKTFCETNGKRVYLDTPNFALKEDIEILRKIIDTTGVKVVANNYYALELSKDIVIGYGLNVYNSYTANELGCPVITAESDISNSVVAPYMTLRHCPIKAHVGGNCENCKYHNGYEYKMDSGKVLKLERKKLSSCTFYLTE